ncbi:unnamed protein product [Gadus morhua 'NCC']
MCASLKTEVEQRSTTGPALSGRVGLTDGSSPWRATRGWGRSQLGWLSHEANKSHERSDPTKAPGWSEGSASPGNPHEGHRVVRRIPDEGHRAVRRICFPCWTEQLVELLSHPGALFMDT